MDYHFEQLKALGAGEFEHLNGSLETHLKNTYTILRDWKASQALCVAGLYHAAYGTDGFDEKMVSLEQRKAIADLIGKDAEALVYLYCSCDRKYTFESLTSSNLFSFKDRFTQTTFTLTESQARDFCELTAANELELCIESEEFKQKHGKGLYSLFQKMADYLSETANLNIEKELAGC